MRKMNAFNGDIYLAKEFTEIKSRFNIQTVIETGTNYGDTTEWLCWAFPQVRTIEIDEGYHAIAQARLSIYKNCEAILGDSSKILGKVLSGCQPPLLVFLDAHWNKHNPLIDELGQIARYGGSTVIVIHDFIHEAL